MKTSDGAKFTEISFPGLLSSPLREKIRRKEEVPYNSYQIGELSKYVRGEEAVIFPEMFSEMFGLESDREDFWTFVRWTDAIPIKKSRIPFHVLTFRGTFRGDMITNLNGFLVHQYKHMKVSLFEYVDFLGVKAPYTVTWKWTKDFSVFQVNKERPYLATKQTLAEFVYKTDTGSAEFDGGEVYLDFIEDKEQRNESQVKKLTSQQILLGHAEKELYDSYYLRG